MRFSSVQTYVTQKVASTLTEKLGSEVTVGGVDIEFLNKLVLKEVYIADHHNDTLIYVQYLKTGLKSYNIDAVQYATDELYIEGAKFYMKQYEGEKDLNLSLWIDKLSSDTTESTGSSFQINCDKLELHNVSYVFLDENSRDTTIQGIDYMDIHAKNIDLLATSVKVNENTYKANLLDFNLKEKSGFELKNFVALVNVDDTKFTLDNWILNANKSKVRGKVTFNYKNGFSDWEEFNDKVKLNAKIKKSQIAFQDVAYFAPALKDVKEVITIEGEIKNQVNRLKSNDLKISFGNNSYLATNFKFKNLTDPDETFVRLQVENLTTNEQDIAKLKFLEGNQPLAVLSKIKKLGQISYKGNITGFYNDLVAYGDLKTDLGTLKTDVSLKSALKDASQLRYSGKLSTAGFNVGQIAEVTELGNIAFNLNVDGHGLNEKTLTSKLNGTVNALTYNNFTYKDVKLNGIYAKQLFDGAITIEQPDVAFAFKGKANLKKGTPEYNFNLDAKKIDLAKLNLVTDSVSEFKGNIHCNLTGKDLDNIAGDLDITNLFFSKNNEQIELGKLAVVTSIKDGYRKAEINSDLVHGELQGNFSITDVVGSITHQFNQLIPDLLTLEQGEEVLGEYEGQKLVYDFELNNTHKIFDVFFPQLHLANNSRVHGEFDAENRTLELLVNSKELTYETNRIQNFYTNAYLSDGILDFTVGTTRLLFKDSLWIDDLNLNGSVYNDTLGFSLDWENRNNNSYRGDIAGYMLLSPLPNVNIKLEHSEVVIADTVWQIKGANEVVMVKDSIVVNDLNIYNKHQSLKINGKLSQNPDDKLFVAIESLNLSNFNLLTPKDANFYGVANANFELSNLLQAPFIDGELNVSAFVFNQHNFGDLNLKTKWKDEKKSMSVNGTLKNDTLESVRIYGNYKPFDKKKQLDLGAKFKEFPLDIINPYIEEFVERVDGSLSGKVRVTGMVEEPKLKGKLKFNETAFTYKMLGTRYILDDDIDIQSGKISFKNVHIKDTLGNKGYINGNIEHKNYDNFDLDVKIYADKLLALNTTEESEDIYYGTAFATGNVFLTGNPDELKIVVKAKSEAGTQINLPIEEDSEAGDGSFIIFIDSTNTQPIQTSKEIKGIEFIANLEVTPDAELQIILDPSVGDIMKGRGTGNLTLELNKLGEFSMHGNYEIERGDYLFTLKGLNKPFDILTGSRITWAGKPLEAMLDIKMLYDPDINPKDLFVGTADSSKYDRTVTVDCIMNIKNRMLSPDVTFDIEFSKADSEFAQEAQTILDNDKDINKQFLSVLVFNRFLTPNTNSGVVNSGVSTTTGELLTNQLSQMLSKFSKDFDVNLGYNSATDDADATIKVGVGFELFDGRATVDASVGNNTASEIVGDFNVEYKITKDGRAKVRAFQRSNEYELFDQSSPYTRGVGLSYSKSFNKFKEFFKKKK